MISARAIHKTIEQVLDGAVGSVRTVAATLIEPGQIPWDGDVLTKPRFDVQLISTGMNDGSPLSHNSDRRIENHMVQVDLYKKFKSRNIQDDKRTIRADMDLIVDTCKQALMRPGNLNATSAGTSTNIISGMLIDVSSSVVSEDWEQQPARIHSQILGTAVIKVTQPTS